MRIAIVTGEHSGDQLAADLILALRNCRSDLQFAGIAGPQMIAAGCKAMLPMERIAYMGLFEVVKHLPSILAARWQIQKQLLANPPDIFIGVDAPDFNLTLAENLKCHGIKTVQYVSPSVWAWRQGRLKKIARAVDLMLTLLPFEAQFYRKNNIPVKFVGHYLADQIPLENDTQAARRALNLPEHARIIALLPGSRSNEIKYLAKVFLQAAQLCRASDQALLFVVPMINAARREMFTQIWRQEMPELALSIVDGQSRTVMAAADVVLLASGTATLEAMLLKKPMVVAYRMSRFSYFIAKRLIKTCFIALPNLLADKALVPEFIQEQATAERLSTALLHYLTKPAQVVELREQFTALHRTLRQKASEHAASAVLSLLAESKSIKSST